MKQIERWQVLEWPHTDTLYLAYPGANQCDARVFAEGSEEAMRAAHRLLTMIEPRPVPMSVGGRGFIGLVGL